MTHTLVCYINTESTADEIQDKENVSTLEAAEPTAAVSEMALPSEPAPDFPLVAQAPANFTLPHSSNLTSTQHGRTSSDGSELNFHPAPPSSREFSSSLDHSIAEGTAGVGSMRESVLPESGSLPAHLSSSSGLNGNQSTARGNLGSTGLLPPSIGGGLSVSSHSSSTNLLSSTNPLSSFLPNPTSLSSLTSIGGSGVGGGSILPSGLRLPDSITSSMSQHPHPPQLPPLPSHLSSLSFMNPFTQQLQSSSLGMGVGGSQQQQQQQHGRGQTQSQVGQNLPAITSAPSSQHLQQPQHNIQTPNVAAPSQQGPSLQQTLTTSAANLPSGGIPPMPLSHNMAAAGGTLGGLPGSLSNPSALPLLPGMHNMYPYPYTGALPSAAAAVQSLPSQPITSAMVRMNTPAFPSISQSLVPGYPSYMAPSLYGNTQPPVTNGSFTR